MPNGPVDVAAGAPNPESYTDNDGGDGTVTDNVTGLVWQQYVPSPYAMYTQAEAVAYCTGLNLAGYADWRLPSYIELFSIVDPSTFSPSIDTAQFPSTPVGPFWSSTSYALAAGDGWAVSFEYAVASHYAVTNTYYARCVR